MAQLKKKISELPKANSLVGLHTIGVDAQNRSVRVTLEGVDTAIALARSAVAEAATALTAANAARAVLPKGLTPTVVDAGPLTISGGCIYSVDRPFTDLEIEGGGEFSALDDSCIVVAPANMPISFIGEGFVLQKDVSAIMGTASQYKVYTIQYTPLTMKTIYLVNCALYG